MIICVAGETSAMDATTTICHRYTPPDQLALLTRSADIIVTAAGELSLNEDNLESTTIQDALY